MHHSHIFHRDDSGNSPINSPLSAFPSTNLHLLPGGTFRFWSFLSMFDSLLRHMRRQHPLSTCTNSYHRVDVSLHRVIINSLNHIRPPALHCAIIQTITPCLVIEG